MKKFFSLIFAALMCASAFAGKVYYLNVNNWSSVYIYCWGGSGSNMTWPGVPMTKESQQINNHDLYSFEGDYANCIFSNNGQSQTADLTWTEGQYYDGSAWNALDGGSTPGGDPTPGTQVYYIKNCWNGGDWTWQEMTPNADKSEWTYTGVYGGTGVNINTTNSDSGAAWFEQGNIQGDAIAAGDNVTFTYNVAGASVRAAKQGGSNPGGNPNPGGDPNPGGGTLGNDDVFYVFGFINGADYDQREMPFDNGEAELIAITQDSYVFVLNGSNGEQYFTNDWQGMNQESVTLYNEKTLEPAKINKYHIAAGTTKLYLRENADGTLTISIKPLAGNALEDVASEEQIQKVFSNGQLIIIKDGVRYSALGQKL